MTKPFDPFADLGPLPTDLAVAVLRADRLGPRDAAEVADDYARLDAAGFTLDGPDRSRAASAAPSRASARRPGR